MAAHAKLSASGSPRWMACPGSIRLSSGIAEQTSPYAAEGTAAHALAELCLREDTDASEAIGSEIEGFEVDDDMASAVQVYLDHVRAIRGDLLIEQRVDFSDYVPGGFGTVDALILRPGAGSIHIVDLKFGRGVEVDAEGNTQLFCYALGALQDFGWLGDFDTVEMTIVQPRRDHISRTAIAVEELKSWAADILAPSAEAALEPDAELVPGETQCRFCPARGVCPALAAHAMETACAGFEPNTRPLAPLTPAEIAKLLDRAKLIDMWLTALRDRATSLAERGEDLPGWKLVAGTTTRRWIDDDAADKALTRAGLKVGQRFAKKVISPAQAEKLLGKDHAVLTKHVTRPDGLPKLAPVTDRRPAIVTDPTDQFTNIAT